MSSEREEREDLAELIALKVAQPLREDLATIRAEAKHTRDEVDRIGHFFRPGPDSLPSQVADLQKVVINQEARLVSVEGGRKLTLLEHVKGGWAAAVALIAALAAIASNVWGGGK